MKLTSIFAAMPLNHGGLLEVKKIVSETLSELGISQDDVNLGYSNLPYYDGIKSGYMNTISESIKDCDGVILYVSASLGLPGALIQTLMEHVSSSDHRGVMQGKNCLVIMHSDDGFGQMAMSFFDLAIYNLGAFIGPRLVVDTGFYENLEEGGKNYQFIERLCEDYYRAIRQQRDIYRPSAAPVEFAVEVAPQIKRSSALQQIAPVIPITSEIKAVGESQPVSLTASLVEDFTEAQQRDIADLAKLFSGKGNDDGFMGLSLAGSSPIRVNPSTPKLIQKTSALMHYYKAGQADGLKSTIAVDINGKDAFTGYIRLDGADAFFKEGRIDNPDVTIIAESDKWSDIVKGKISAQKAFMIGQIKVRGNFVLLGRFDQLFDFSKNSD